MGNCVLIFVEEKSKYMYIIVRLGFFKLVGFGEVLVYILFLFGELYVVMELVVVF